MHGATSDNYMVPRPVVEWRGCNMESRSLVVWGGLRLPGAGRFEHWEHRVS